MTLNDPEMKNSLPKLAFSDSVKPFFYVIVSKVNYKRTNEELRLEMMEEKIM